MKHIGLINPSKLIDTLNWIGPPIIVIYFFSMFAYPWLENNGDWTLVQNVWDRWQSLNVGMLAFISSLIAFNIARYNAEKQRKRDFSAAKAFLPAALAELCEYLKSSANIFIQGWEIDDDNVTTVETPNMPVGYKDVFQNCIRYAEDDVGDYLAYILMRLQIHNSRLSDYVNNLGRPDRLNPDRHNLFSYLFRLGELQALIGKLFKFARNEESFKYHSLEWEDYSNAYGNLEIWYSDFKINETMNLEDLTKRAIANNEII